MSKIQYKCPHCGSDKDAFFSCVEPMGFHCPDCGEDVDACPECLEQARLLGRSAEREADLLGKLERECALADQLGIALSRAMTMLPDHEALSWTELIKISRWEKLLEKWKEARSE